MEGDEGEVRAPFKCDEVPCRTHRSRAVHKMDSSFEVVMVKVIESCMRHGSYQKLYS